MTTFGSLFKGGGSRWTATQGLLVLLLLCAVLLGGSPNQPALRTGLICLVASALAAWALAHGAARAFARLPALTRLGVVLFPALWLLQLVPLPPALWELLPGRELAHRVFDLIGTRADNHPLSLTPADTLFGAVMFVPCLAAFLAALTLDDRGRQRCVAAFLVLVGVSIFVGLVQMSSRGAVLNFHDSTHKANLLGFFANRNHQSLMVAIAGVLAVYVVGREIKRRGAALGISLVLSLVLLTAAVGTTSRAGLGLTILGLMSIHLAMFSAGWSRRRWIKVAAGILAAAILGYLLSLNPVVEKSLARFDAVGEDSRWQFWAGSAPLIDQYFPWGGGLGGFIKHYNPVESLDMVHPQYLNHVHNDYLEVLIEGGLPGVGALLIFALGVVVRAVRLQRMQGWSGSAFTLPAGMAIVLVALHSIVDYPLRTQALAVVFGMLAAFYLADPASARARTDALRRDQDQPLPQG